MVSEQKLRQFSSDIARKFPAVEKIILFGSYAYGVPKQDSDVDLLVVMPFGGRALDKIVEIRAAVNCDFPLDLIVRTPQRLEKQYQQFDPIARWAIDEGRVLYERGCSAVA